MTHSAPTVTVPRPTLGCELQVPVDAWFAHHDFEDLQELAADLLLALHQQVPRIPLTGSAWFGALPEFDPDDTPLLRLWIVPAHPEDLECCASLQEHIVQAHPADLRVAGVTPLHHFALPTLALSGAQLVQLWSDDDGPVRMRLRATGEELHVHGHEVDDDDDTIRGIGCALAVDEEGLGYNPRLPLHDTGDALVGARVPNNNSGLKALGATRYEVLVLKSDDPDDDPAVVGSAGSFDDLEEAEAFLSEHRDRLDREGNHVGLSLVLFDAREMKVVGL